MKVNEKPIIGENEDGTLKQVNIITETTSSLLKKDKKVIEEFKTDPEKREIALVLAHQIQKEFTGWFTIPKLIEVFSVDTVEASKKLEMLMLLNFCVGKVEKRIPYFKIDLDLK